MKVPTVQKFLCYFDLTTGGLVLGYIGAISNAAYALILMFDLVSDTERFKNDVLQFAEGVEELSPATELVEDLGDLPAIEEYKLPTWVFVILASILIGILVVCCLVSLWFIQGVKDRDPRKMRYFLIIMVVGICSSFLKGIVSLSFTWMLISMLNVYFFICVYSLHQVLESEVSGKIEEQSRCHEKAGKMGYTECTNGWYSEDAERGYQTSEFNR